MFFGPFAGARVEESQDPESRHSESTTRLLEHSRTVDICPRLSFLLPAGSNSASLGRPSTPGPDGNTERYFQIITQAGMQKAFILITYKWKVLLTNFEQQHYNSEIATSVECYLQVALRTLGMWGFNSSGIASKAY